MDRVGATVTVGGEELVGSDVIRIGKPFGHKLFVHGLYSGVLGVDSGFNLGIELRMSEIRVFHKYEGYIRPAVAQNLHKALGLFVDFPYEGIGHEVEHIRRSVNICHHVRYLIVDMCVGAETEVYDIGV